MLAAWSLTVISFDKWNIRGLSFPQDEKRLWVTEIRKSFIHTQLSRNDTSSQMFFRSWLVGLSKQCFLYDPTLLFFPVNPSITCRMQWPIHWQTRSVWLRSRCHLLFSLEPRWRVLSCIFSWWTENCVEPQFFETLQSGSCRHNCVSLQTAPLWSHNSLSYPCWLGSSLDSWSDHTMLCADTVQFERFCAQFSARKERVQTVLSAIPRRTRTIDGNSLTLFWEFRVKNWGQSRRHHHNFPHPLLFWLHVAHHKSSTCSQRSTWNHVNLSSRSVTQQPTTCFLLRLLPITLVVRDTRVPKLSLNVRRPIGSPPPEWWTAKGLLQYRNRLSSMSHTVFNILQVLSCLKLPLSLPCLSFASLLFSLVSRTTCSLICKEMQERLLLTSDQHLIVFGLIHLPPTTYHGIGVIPLALRRGGPWSAVFFPTEEASPIHFQCSPLSLFAPMATKMSSTSPADATPPDVKMVFTCTVSSTEAVPKIWRARLSPWATCPVNHVRLQYDLIPIQVPLRLEEILQ